MNIGPGHGDSFAVPSTIAVWTQQRLNELFSRSGRDGQCGTHNIEDTAVQEVEDWQSADILSGSESDVTQGTCNVRFTCCSQELLLVIVIGRLLRLKTRI